VKAAVLTSTRERAKAMTEILDVFASSALPRYRAAAKAARQTVSAMRIAAGI
jgi:hypothetical protein